MNRDCRQEHYLGRRSGALTVFSGLDVQHVAPHAVSCLRVGQHLDAVVGELLQAPQLHLLPGGGDVLHLAPFCSHKRERVCKQNMDRGRALLLT